MHNTVPLQEENDFALTEYFETIDDLEGINTPKTYYWHTVNYVSISTTSVDVTVLADNKPGLKLRKPFSTVSNLNVKIIIKKLSYAEKQCVFRYSCLLYTSPSPRD